MSNLDTLPFDAFAFLPIGLICDANLLRVSILCIFVLLHDVVDLHRLIFSVQAIVPLCVFPQLLCALILEASSDLLLAYVIPVLLTARPRILDATFAYRALLCVASQSTTINRAVVNAITYAFLTIHVYAQPRLESPIFACHSACDEDQLNGV